MADFGRWRFSSEVEQGRQRNLLPECGPCAHGRCCKHEGTLRGRDSQKTVSNAVRPGFERIASPIRRGAKRQTVSDDGPQSVAERADYRHRQLAGRTARRKMTRMLSRENVL